MRKANNNSNFTVEALVAKYRNFINDKVSIQGDPLFDKQIGKYADHQLLIALYKSVTGQSADSYIVEGLSAYYKAFKKDALSEDEFLFLCNNFKNVVDYIFSDKLSGVNDHVSYAMDSLRADRDFLSIMGKIANTTEGAVVFIEEDIMGDIAMLFPQCTIMLEESAYEPAPLFPIGRLEEDREANALKMIRFFVYGIHSKVIKNLKDEKMDIIIRNFPGRLRENQQSLMVSSLKSNGQMFLNIKSEQLLGKDWQKFRDLALSSKRISAVVRYGIDGYFMVADNSVHTSICMQDELVGTLKDVLYEQIDKEILLPGYYLIEKPISWVPLSTLVDTLEIPRIDVPGVHKGVSSGNKVLLQKELGVSFMDANISNKNLYYVSDLTDNSDPWGGMNFTGWHSNVLPCVYLWGFERQYRIGYVDNAKNEGYAIPYQMATLIPKDGINIRYVAALLFFPEVRRQVEVLYCGEHVVSTMPIILRHIYVPNHTDKERETFLNEANYSAMENMVNNQKNAQEAYVKAIRLRKHALTQSLSSIESMFYALNNYRINQKGLLHDVDVISRVKGTTVRDAFEFLSKNIGDMMPALEHIAEVEYSFSKPEWIDPEKFVEEYISRNENGWLYFKPVVTWDKGNNQAQKDITNPAGDIILRKGEPICKFLFPKVL